MKGIFKVLTALAVLAVFMFSCSSPLNRMTSPDGAKPMPDKEFYEITNGVFLGGGILYHKTNPALNHFSQLQTIPLRLAKLTVTTETEEVDEDTLDAEGNVVSSKKVTETTPKFQDIPESVLVGQMDIQDVSESGIIFDFELLNPEKLVKFRKEGAKVKPGETYDFNEDGIADISYREFNADTRTGYDGVFELAFLSSKEKLHTTMHKSPDDPEFRFPSGIVTINPSGRIILDSNNFFVLSKNDSGITIGGENIPDVVKGDFIIDSEDKSIRIIESKTVNGEQMVLSTRIIPSFMAYEVMNLGVKGNLEEVTRRYLRSTDSRALASRSYNLSLLNQRGTKSLPLPEGWSGYANLEYALGLSIDMDAGTSFNWDEASAFAYFKVNSNASVIFDAFLATSWSHQFSQILAQPEFSFFIGPVPISMGATLLIGADVEFKASGRLRMGGGFESTLGAEAGAKIWVDWDWWNTKIRSRAWMNPVNVFDTNIVEPVMDLTGTATLTPYFEVQPFFMVARMASVYVKLRTYAEGSASVTLSTDTGTTANVKLDLGVKGLDPSLFLGIDILGFKLGKDFHYPATFFDLRKTIYNQTMSFAKPPKPLTSTPVFSTAGGSFYDSVDFSLSTTTPGADIRYTTDGTNPTASSGTLYTGPIHITNPTTVKAVAYKHGNETSPLVSQTYNILKFVEAPAVSLASGNYTTEQMVVLSTPTPGASIRYTLDGTDPTPSKGMVYGGPILVNKSLKLKALGYRDGWTSSAVASRVYTITGLVATPQIYPPAAGNFYSSQIITMETSTPEAQIWYTIDGSAPGPVGGKLYTGSFVLSTSGTVRAKATKTNWLSSLENSQTYSITGSVAAPVISQAGGTYTQNSLSMTLSSSTPGAQIRYTLDGTSPSDTVGTLYSGSLTLTQSATVKAVAFKSGWQNSNVTSSVFTLKATPPSFTLASGYYETAQSTKINVPAGLQVRYTTDGSLPNSTTGTLYSAGADISIPLGEALEIKAVAFKAGLQDSNVVTGSYATGVLGSPTFSLTSGVYQNNQTLTLSAYPAGAAIRYTTNGVDPTSSTGTLYTGPIPLTGSTTVKAMASHAGYPDSPVSSGTYTFVAAPVQSSKGTGLYPGAVSVELSTTTNGAQIRYTLDGSTPSAINGAVYSGALAVDKNKTLKAVAVKAGYSDSEIGTWEYSIRAGAPSFTSASGTYLSSKAVTITANSGLSIRYTLDGTNPTSSYGTLYTGPFELTTSATVKAVAYSSEFVDSQVSSATYTIKAEDPTLSFDSGSYDSALSLTMTTGTPGAQIRYTLDGSTPTASSSLYTSTLTVDSNKTVKALAMKSGVSNSEVVSKTYTFGVQTPTMDKAEGTYSNSVTVTLATATTGASIRYTTDGSNPTETTGTVYSGPVTMTSSGTLKAIAYKTGWTSSSVTSRSFTIKVANPVSSKVTGTYDGTISVTLSTSTPGATIRYTTDGTAPSVNAGVVYSSAINISATTTLKFIAYKSGLAASDVMSVVYTIVPRTITRISISGSGVNGGAGSPSLSWLTYNLPNSSNIYTNVGSIGQGLYGPINVTTNLSTPIAGGKYFLLKGKNEGSESLTRTFTFYSNNGWSQVISITRPNVDYIIRDFDSVEDNLGYVRFYFDGQTVTWAQQ